MKKKKKISTILKSFVGDIPQPIPNTNQVKSDVIPDYLTSVQVSDTGNKSLLIANNYRVLTSSGSDATGPPTTLQVDLSLTKNFKIKSLSVECTKSPNTTFAAVSYVSFYLNGFLIEKMVLSGTVSPQTLNDALLVDTLLQAPATISIVLGVSTGSAGTVSATITLAGFYFE